jgi:ParB family chromosome partitioning protein
VDSGLNYVVAGERRCATARQASLVSIPGIFIDSQNHTEIALVENLLRQDLTAVEEAEALSRLQEDHQYQQDDLVRIFGKSKATISETLSLNKLPQEIRDECRTDPSVPKRTLIEIARLSARWKQQTYKTIAPEFLRR